MKKSRGDPVLNRLNEKVGTEYGLGNRQARNKKKTRDMYIMDCVMYGYREKTSKFYFITF